MRISGSLKIVCVWTLSIMLSHLPNVAAAEAIQAIPGLVRTSQVVSDLNRQKAEKDLQELISKDDVKNQLMKAGITEDEASQRIASLSDQELKQFHDQVVEARAGGDILMAILIVVLIIFLVKRI